MYKLSVPVSMETLTDENLPRFHETFSACGVKRVFICCLNNVYLKSCKLDTDFHRFEVTVRYFKERGYEVSIWIGGLGHGAPLSHVSDGVQHKSDFTMMEGADGSKLDALCPLDQNLIDCFSEEIKRLAAIEGLDIIMIDDDFRLNMRRGQNMACCCPLHMAEYRRRLGEDVPRDRLETLVFGGSKNRYRDEWLRLSGDTLRNFASKMREAADSVNPSIRLGFCGCYDTWDMDGTDCIELSRIFAGDTAPYLRTIEKPYQDATIANAEESTRMQAKWCRDAGIEVYTEGDVYPRPRYNIPARGLDVGLASVAPIAANAEYFVKEDKQVISLARLAFRALTCSPKADILTYFDPSHVPASYLYENVDGRRVYVLGYDAYANDEDCHNYFTNYYRNRQLPQALARVANAPMPAVYTGHPFLYSIVSESPDRKKLSVPLINTFEDEIFSPVVTLQKPYSSIRSVHSTATLNGNTVTLSDIEPYGFAAFEVEG